MVSVLGENMTSGRSYSSLSKMSISAQVKLCSKVMPVECSRRLWQDNMLDSGLRPKYHKNMPGILNSELVKVKQFSSLQELTAHDKSVWSYFKCATLRNSAVDMPQSVFI